MYIKEYQLDEFWRKKIEDYYLIRELNFEKDLDENLNSNSVFNIDSNGYLSFICEKEDGLPKKLVKIQEKNNQLQQELLPSSNYPKKEDINSNILKSDKYSHYLIDEQINKRCIYIDKYNIKSDLIFMISSNKQKKMLINDNIEFDNLVNNEYLKDITGVICHVTGNLATIQIYEESIYKTKNEITIYFDNTIDKILIDFQNKKAVFWDLEGKVKIAYLGFNKDEVNCLVSLKQSIIDEKLKHISFANKEGQIYFKDINLSIYNLDLQFLFKGTPKFEISNKYNKKWVRVEKEIKSNSNKLRSRLNLNMHDKIIDISFVKHKKELINEYDIIHEIDFQEDIDTDKSDYFIINEVKKYLEFRFKEIKRIEKNDCMSILGKIHFNGSKIEMITEPINSNSSDNILVSSILIEDLIENKIVDFINIKFNINSNDYFYFRLCNYYFYKIFEKIKSKQLMISNEMFDTNDCITVDHVFHNKKLQIKGRKGLHLDNNDLVSLQLRNHSYTNLLVNLNENFIEIENKKCRVDYRKILKDDKKCVYLHYFKNQTNKESKVVLSRVSYCKKEGYIYFKPIKHIDSNIDIILMSDTSENIEYSQLIDDKWREFDNNKVLDSTKPLFLRLKMRKGARINKMFIVKKQKI